MNGYPPADMGRAVDIDDWYVAGHMGRAGHIDKAYPAVDMGRAGLVDDWYQAGQHGLTR